MTDTDSGYPEGYDIVAELAAGRARLMAPGEVTFNLPDDPADVPMLVKSLRVPIGMYEAALAQQHPDGFSGVVREALGEWLARHGSPEQANADALAALATLQRFVGQQQSAQRAA